MIRDMGLQRVGVRRAPDEMSLPHKQSNRGRGPEDATKYPSLSNDQVFCIRLWSYKYDLYQAPYQADMPPPAISGVYQPDTRLICVYQADFNISLMYQPDIPRVYRYR